LQGVVKRPMLIAVSLLVGLGLWQVGEGTWIYLKAHLAQSLLQRAWARTVDDGSRVAPWPWADTWPVARLRIPAHGVDLIVLAGVSGRTLAFGPGHATISVRPGAPGTSIVTGHRDTHFRFLSRMRVGDDIEVETAGQLSIHFTVRETTVVDARTAAIRSAADTTSLVLLTCYPFDAVVPGGPLRYAVVADRAPGGAASARPDRPMRLVSYEPPVQERRQRPLASTVRGKNGRMSRSAFGIR
jgi:sortase A